MITGISIDAPNTRMKEDGFTIESNSGGYLLTFAVVDLGGKLKKYKDYLTGHYRSYLFPENGIKKDELSFCNKPRDAIIFKVNINNHGSIERFKVQKDLFQLTKSYSFNDEIEDEQVQLAVDCMNLVAESGVHPFLTRSTTTNQLVQNLNLFISLSLFDHMVNHLGISVLYTGVTAGTVLGGTEGDYRADAGRLCVLSPKYAIKIINGEGFLVRTETKRDWIYKSTDVNAGSYIVSISSPFRNDDALINQIILSEYLDGNECIHSEDSEMRIYGLPVENRNHYLQMTNRSSQFARDPKSDSIQELSGKLLKDFISLLVDYKLDSQQIDKLSDKAQTSINDQVVLASYYLGLNKELPVSIKNWIRSICVEGKATTGTFLHILNGMPFVVSNTTGGVVSIDINNRLFEVDDCSGYKVRLVKKLYDNNCRDIVELPNSFPMKLKLLNKLFDDSEIKLYLANRGINV